MKMSKMVKENKYFQRMEETDRVPLEACIEGRIYKLASRNLEYGVFDGQTGFIGIRSKFGSRFLFTEFHWDQGPPHGTVFGVEDTGVNVPNAMVLATSLGTEDEKTGRLIRFDKPVADGGRGWVYLDTDQRAVDTLPVSMRNKELFDFLDDFEKRNKIV